MRPRDAWIVSLVRPFRFECVRDAGRVPSNITAPAAYSPVRLIYVHIIQFSCCGLYSGAPYSAENTVETFRYHYVPSMSLIYRFSI